MASGERDTRPILVTGGHRSGTGWVGQLLATSAYPVGYVWEPFSIRHRLGVLDIDWTYWFPYVTDVNGDAYRAPIRRTLEWHYSTLAEVKSLRSAKDLGRMGRDRWHFGQYRRQNAIPLFKDPIAIFSVEWLVREFDFRVVLLVRHPAAFVSSLKRLNWTHPFDHFTRQPLLMELVSPYAAQLEEFAATQHDIIDQGILLWNVMHHAMIGYVDRHPDWVLVRQEDLAFEPHAGFEQLFCDLGLPYGPTTAQEITATTSASNPHEGKLGSIHRDSATHARNWTRGLTAHEITRIRVGTEAVAFRFYGDQDW